MEAQANTPNPKGESSASGANGFDTKDHIPGGRYHIVERLSTSALGAVYKALDTILDRPVAIKCVRLDTPFAERTPDELRERFVREARIVARLQHANIVTIHDIVATPDRGFIIMEFIEGRTLESLNESEGRLPLSAAIQIITQLGSALDYAHERNVVHRDVKPSNILVSSSLNVWVADFGIAKSELSTNLTMAGGVLGAPDYMSPEHAKGEDVDARSDLFSLGCILFELAVGDKPFRSPSLTGVLLSIINDEPVFPLNWQSLELPMALKPILHHALEKERDKRFASGAELVAALENLPKMSQGDADAVADAVGSAFDRAIALAPEPAPAAESAPALAPEPEKPSLGSEDGEKQPLAQSRPEEEKSEATNSEPEAVEENPALEDLVAEPVQTDPSPPAQEQLPEPTLVEAAPAGDESGEDASSTVSSEAKPEEAAKVDEPTSSDEAVMAEATGNADAVDDDATPEMDAERIKQLKDGLQVLQLSPTLSQDLQGVEITPEEGFLLSRIDGSSRPKDIIAVSPMSESNTESALLSLLEKNLIRLGGVVESPARSASTAKQEPSPSMPSVDEAVVAELDRLLALGRKRDFSALLGVSDKAAESERKSSYLKLVGKYHPDRYPGADEVVRDKLSQLCAPPPRHGGNANRPPTRRDRAPRVTGTMARPMASPPPSTAKSTLGISTTVL